MNKKLRNIIMSLTLSSVLLVPSFADESILSIETPVGESSIILESELVIDDLKIQYNEVLDILKDYKTQFKDGEISEAEYNLLTKEHFEKYKLLSSKIYDKKTNTPKVKYMEIKKMKNIKDIKNIKGVKKEFIKKNDNNIIEKLKIQLQNGEITQVEYDEKYKAYKENSSKNVTMKFKSKVDPMTVEESIEYYENYLLEYEKEYKNGKLSEERYNKILDSINKKIEYYKAQN